jgi:type VI secretion system protein ImpC
MPSDQVVEQTTAAPATVTTEAAPADEFQSLLTRAFRPRSNDQAVEIRAAVERLVQEAVKDVRFVSNNAIRSIQAMIADIDEKLSKQLNHVLHHPDFQKVEGTWRGLHYLANNSETDRMLKIKFLNISKEELSDELSSWEGALWDQSAIFKRIYTDEYSQFGGMPFGCLVGDFYFDHSPSDARLLGNMANVCSASHTPFVAAASPGLFGMESWQELMDPIDLSMKQDNVAYAKWDSLRASEDSRFIGLTLPRVLARLPYGAATTPVKAFDFEEEVAGTDHHRYCWMNAAYAMGVNINRSFKLYGWCTRIRGVQSGGAVRDLPVHTFPTDDGGVAMKCPTEIAIDQRREYELAKLGLMPLIHRKNTDIAAFIGAQSLQKPKEFYDDDATANANLSARLPYLFASCRFAHYLKKMTYDYIGTFKEREDMQSFLQSWIMNYVDMNPNFSTETQKSEKPLRSAEVVVEEVRGNPGFYNAHFYLRPHYQLEGVNIAMSLVSKLPKERAAG